MRVRKEGCSCLRASRGAPTTVSNSFQAGEVVLRMCSAEARLSMTNHSGGGTGRRASYLSKILSFLRIVVVVEGVENGKRA